MVTVYNRSYDSGKFDTALLTIIKYNNYGK